MKTNNEGLNLIKSFEGCRLNAYKALPSEKYNTIGYGHYGPDVTANMKITQAEADAMLVKDLERFEEYVTTYTKGMTLTSNQFSALVSFCYNCGPGNLKKLIAKGSQDFSIPDSMLDFNHAGGKELAGLTRRRKAERDLYLKGENMKRTLIIGSARIDENGRTVGGAKGDQKQTSKIDFNGEVSLQEYYNHKKGWNVLRHKNEKIAELIASAMTTACGNSDIGYNQADRLSIIDCGVGTDKPCNCDCSSLVRACILAAGGKDPGNFTTANEKDALLATGEWEVIEPLQVELEPGDVLVTKTKGHTAIIAYVKTDEKPQIVTPYPPTLKQGSTGSWVKTLQLNLRSKGYTIAVDGEFGPITKRTVINWQLRNNLVGDGIVGKMTWSSLGF